MRVLRPGVASSFVLFAVASGSSDSDSTGAPGTGGESGATGNGGASLGGSGGAVVGSTGGGGNSSNGGTGNVGDAGATSGGSTSGGAAAGGASSGGGGAVTSGGAGGSTSCTAPTPTEVLADLTADHLTLAGSGVVFIDRSAGQPYPTGPNGGAVRFIGADGTGDRTLYTAPADHMILSLTVFGNDVFFLEDTYAGTGQPDDVALHRVPHTSGSAALVGSLARPKAAVTELIAAEAGQVFVNFGDDGLLRVALPGGAVQTVTPERLLRNTALIGNDIYYEATRGVGMNGLMRIAKTATNATGTILDDRSCDDGLVSQAGIFCCDAPAGVDLVVRYGLDGLNRTDLGDIEPIDFPHVVAVDATNAYVASGDLASSLGHPIWRVPTAGGAKTPVACDRQTFLITAGAAPSPTNGVQNLQFVIGATDLFWLERRTNFAPMSLFKNPK